MTKRVWFPVVILAAVALAVAAAAFRGGRPAGPNATVVTTTSMLAGAARAILEGTDGIRIVTLVPPGGCPGHFDLPPGAAEDLRAARAVLCHDYQTALRERLTTLGVPPDACIVVETPGSLLIPDHYRAVLHRVSGSLAACFPDRRARLEANARTAVHRLTALADAIRTETTDRPWRNGRAVASRHQMDFCRWLGVDVTYALPRPEDLPPQGWAEILSTPADLVVANLQEGTRAAEALGRDRKLPVAVFSNFPGAPGYGSTYEELLRANVRRLDEAWASR
jgi:hypothetical protein